MNLRANWQWEPVHSRIYVNTPSGRFVQYNALGNITKKGSVTDYTYGQSGAGPHAVTTANGISHLWDPQANQ